MKGLLGAILILIVAGIVLFGLIQLIPYGKNHQNPPVVSEPNWDSPQTRQIAKKACFDCHSNETVWPSYSKIAPGSWFIYRDVIEGRSKMNFSDWQTSRLDEPQEIAEVIRGGEMPPLQYLILHPEARLSTAEKEALISGLLKITR
jgi:cytochrome c551/c552